LLGKAGAHAGLGAVVVKLLEKVGLHVGGVDEAAIDTEIRSRAARGVEGVVRSCATCFVAGTLVATPRGERAIESLRVGDSVLAEDPTAGTVEAEAVQAVIQDPVSPLLAVELGDGSAITTTVTHSFWVDEGPSRAGWLEAGQLRVGDRLREADGTEAVVAGLRRNVGRAVVYTLTVARDHTFFVGSARVLVHNASDCPAWIFLKDLPPAEKRAVGQAIRRITGREAPPTGRLGRNWGAIFRNLAGDLPQAAAGYYHEYTVLLPESTQRGVLRIVTGARGEVYYSWTHYGDAGLPAFVRLS
jgi:hypothetical protein